MAVSHDKDKDKEKWHGGDDVGAIVVDIGSHTSRVGYAGDDSPKQLWDSIVGLPSGVLQESISADKYIFPLNLYTKRESTDVRPVLFHSNGEIGFDCDAFERIVQRCCSREIGLGVCLEGKPVLLTEPTRHYKALRAKMVELMFEKFQTEAVYVAKSAALSAFASGKATACVVDIGALGTCVAPVQDGYTLQRSLNEFRVGGNLLENELGALLAQKGYNITPKFATQRPSLLVGHQQGSSNSLVTNTYLEYGKRQVVRDLKVSMCRCAEDARAAAVAADMLKRQQPVGKRASENVWHELPDGTPILQAEEMGAATAEMLFNPQNSILTSQGNEVVAGFSGVPRAIFDCISKCDVDLRKELLSSIILTGGCSLIGRFPERIQRELQEDEKLFGNSTKFKIVSHSATIERHFSSWIGGSILASLGTFQQMWMSRVEYGEHGAQLVERKCMQ